jgi:hypothetical protein
MAIGRISGPMLKPNLERQGVDLAFETDLLYLDVTDGRIGIKNSAPTAALDVTGSGKFSNNLTTLGITNLGNLRLSNNTLEAVNLDGNVYINANGVGIVSMSPDVSVAGNLTVTGTTFLNSTNTYFLDAVLDIGTGANGANLTTDDGKDRGLALHYYSGSDKKGFLGQASADEKLYWYVDATSSAGVYSGTLGTIVSGSIESANIAVTSTATLGNIAIYDNNIDSINSNGDIEIEANGTGIVRINSNVGIQTVGAIDFPLVVDSTTGIVIPVGSDAQRPAVEILVPGVVRLNSDSGDFEGWNGTDWLPLSQASSANTFFSTIFTGDGSTVDFELPGYPTTNSTFVSIEGVLQQPGTAYSVAGQTLTLVEAPPSGYKIEVRTITALGETVSAVSTVTYDNLDTNLTVIDQWSLTSFRSADYIVQIDNGAGEYQQSRINLIHNGTNVTLTESNRIYTGASPLATISAYIALGQVRLRATAAAGSANMVTMTRTLLSV